MTDRKPDIITKWSIKKNEDNSNCEGEWVATCSAYPNIKICGDDPDDIVFAIKKKLSELYEQHMGYYDGGITGYTADVRLYLAREKSLDYFSTNVEGSKDTNDTKDTDAVRAKLLDIGKQLLNSEDGLRALDNGGVTICLDEMPSDDQTPEPATDAPELHEPEEQPKKKPKAKKEKKLFPKPCSTCFHLSPANQCACPKSPNYRIPIRDPDNCTCVCCHETKEQYDARLAKGYKWERITELVSSCALCDRLREGTCAGNKTGEFCNNYVCRDDAGTTCTNCKNCGGKLGYQQGDKDTYMCDHHKQPIYLDDFCCYAYKGR